jgi:transcriptional regulator with XRE-family HTH domain
MADSSPTVARFRLGAALRRARENIRISGDTMATRLRWSPSKVSRAERGDHPVPLAEVRKVLSAYGITDADDAQRLSCIAEDSHQPAWWADKAWELSPAQAEVIGLEAGASHITCYEPSVVPVILQCAEYTQALVTGAATVNPASPGRQARQLQLAARRARWALGGPQITAVLDEAVLYRPVGGPGVLKRQLAHLADIASQANVRIAVLPVAAERLVLPGPFTVLSFAVSHGEPLDDVLITGGVVAYLPEPEVWQHTRSFAALSTAALDWEATRALLGDMAAGTRPSISG